MLSNPNVRAVVLAILPGIVLVLTMLQQDQGWQDAVIAGAIAVVTQLIAQYGTPLNKSVGVGQEALKSDGTPVA